MLKIKNPSRISVPKRCQFDVNNNFIPTAESNAQPAGFKPLIAPFMFLFVRNLSITLKTIVTMIYDGKIIAVVATKEPKSPAVVKPANVATFTPTGPGVMDEIASISVNCFALYQ